MNNPYSLLRQFVAKAVAEMANGVTSVFLIPARTDTRAFAQIFQHAAEIRFVIGRIKFLNHKGIEQAPAPFPSCVVVFKPGRVGEPKVTTMKAVQP